MNRGYIDHFHQHGFAVIRGVFKADEIAEAAAAFDRIKARALGYRTSFRHQNVFFQLSEDPSIGKQVRLVQWPSYFDEILNRIRLDRRLHDLLAPLIGKSLKQIINQMHWKQPGAAQTSFGYHQDIWFRRPREAYRDPESSFIQTGIAIDPQKAANGAMTFYPGSHLRGSLSLPGERRIMDRSMDERDLHALGLDPAEAVTVEMAPGDLAIWNLFVLHGSGPNTTGDDRRLYINGYVSADKCDRGEWAFRDGAPCALGEPTLVHYEDLYRRPQPHYVDMAR